MPVLNKPGFHGPACSLQPAPFPLSDPHSSVELPNRGSALTVQHGRYPSMPGYPLRHQGGSTGCAACRPFSSGSLIPSSCTPFGALLPSFDLGLVVGCLSWSVERTSACLIGHGPGVVSLRRRSLIYAKWGGHCGTKTPPPSCLQLPADSLLGTMSSSHGVARTARCRWLWDSRAFRSMPVVPGRGTKPGALGR